MPRKAKPFFHQGHFYTTAGGKWRKLCPESAGEAEAARLLVGLQRPVTPTTGVTVTLRDAAARYVTHCRGYYVLPGGRVSSEPRSVELALSYLWAVAGELPTAQLTKEHLKAARDAMRETCSRKTINQHVGRIKRCARWLADENLMPDSAAASLCMLKNLPAYRSGAVEHEPVTAVPWSDVRPVVEAIAEPWKTLILVQWWSGLRPAEACGLTVAQCQVDGELITLAFGRAHKSGWRERDKVVPLGPQASRLLVPLIWAAEVAEWPFLFKTTWITKATETQAKPSSYAHAVANCCKRIGVEHWHPNQLRHAYATRVRAALGLEAAQHALGHARADVTQVYAEAAAGAAARAARAARVCG